MKETLSYLLWVLTIIFVGTSCKYSDLSGPFDFDFSIQTTILGYISFIIAYVLTINSSISKTTKGVTFLVCGILTLIVGLANMAYTKSIGTDPEGPVAPDKIYVIILYIITTFLIRHGLVFFIIGKKTST